MEPQNLINGQSGQSNSQVPTGLDPTAFFLAKSIKNVETSGSADPYNATGKNGEYGAYQFMPDTWKLWASQYIGDPNAPMTEENQNKVAYYKIKDWLSQGYTHGQIASLWNSGKPDYQGNIGTNKKGVNYNTPEYVAAVKKAYTQYNQGVTPSGIVSPSTVGRTNQSNDTQTAQFDNQNQGYFSSLGTDLGNRAGELSGAVSQTVSGKINPLSGLIQVGGAIAGGLGDLVNRTLELVPGVKAIQDVIGNGIKSFIQTPSGQSIVSSINDFSQAHPELSSDIGAGFNILTAIPILKGISMIKNVALDSASMALKDTAENYVSKSIAGDIIRGTRGAVSSDSVLADVKNWVSNRMIPEVDSTGGVAKWDTVNAMETGKSLVKSIDENQLQPILDEVSSRQTIGQNINTLRKNAIKMAEQDPFLKKAGAVPDAIKFINKKFDGWQYSFGDNIGLSQENIMKRGSGFFANWNSPEQSAGKVIYSSLQKDIENIAAKNGFTNVAEINKSMGSLLDSIDSLNQINGKRIISPRRGLLSKIARNASTIGGSIASNALGAGPIAGAVGGYTGEGLIEGLLSRIKPSNIANGILNRTSPYLQRVPFSVGKTAGLLSPSLLRGSGK
jgi:hypothetical protein